MDPQTINRFEKSPGLWVIVALIVGLNLWFDYYHQGWLVVDAVFLIFVIVVVVKWRRTRRNPGDRSEN